MSGRAVILLVVGIIVIAGTIIHRIEAASETLVENSVGYYKRQTARNLAQSGVNLALRHLGNDSSWRTTGWTFTMMKGSVTVQVFDTGSYLGVTPAIGIRSTGVYYDTIRISTAYCYFPPAIVPSFVRGLLTLNSMNQVNGSIIIDARDHDTAGVVIPGQGTYAAWTTGPSFSISGSAALGGTAGGIDYPPPPSGIANPGIVLLNQVVPPPGYPGTPDSIFGGASTGYPEGTLKAIAQSGMAGSQYTTNPSTIRMPLSGVTYVEMPIGSPVWTPAAITGSGILIVHNTAKTACIKGAQGTFRGIVLSDDITNLHGTIMGAIMGMTTFPAGNILGNGGAQVQFSRQAIKLATKVFSNGAQPNVIAWWE